MCRVRFGPQMKSARASGTGKNGPTAALAPPFYCKPQPWAGTASCPQGNTVFWHPKERVRRASRRSEIPHTFARFRHPMGGAQKYVIPHIAISWGAHWIARQAGQSLRSHKRLARMSAALFSWAGRAAVAEVREWAGVGADAVQRREVLQIASDPTHRSQQGSPEAVLSPPGG